MSGLVKLGTMTLDVADYPTQADALDHGRQRWPLATQRTCSMNGPGTKWIVTAFGRGA